METEEAVVLLGAVPAIAYREYLYRPGGDLARWIDERFEVLARPGHRAGREVRAGDLLVEVALGRTGQGWCVALTADRLDALGLGRGRLAPGRLVLRPRERAEVMEPLPVEPGVVQQGSGAVREEPVEERPLDEERPFELVVEEHDSDEAPDPAPPVRQDAEVAVPRFTDAERARVTHPLLSARASAKAVAWTGRMHPPVSGVTVKEIRSVLRDYVDPVAVQSALARRNRSEPGETVDASSPETDAVFVECVHQFQIKCYLDQREHDGQAGESTLDSLGLIVRAGSGFRRADRGNARALKRLRALDAQKGFPPGEFTSTNWFDAMTDPSVFGWRTSQRTGLHVLLVRRLRKAERHLLDFPAYRGMPPAALGRALRLGEDHGGARPDQPDNASPHTFGLAIDIAYRANPWVHKPHTWQAMCHAALLVSGESLKQSSAPAYFHRLGSDPARTTDQIWEELRCRSEEFAAYFRLGKDGTKLREALVKGRARGTPGLMDPDETIDQAAAVWQTRIEQDRRNLTSKTGDDFFHHVPPENGFLSLPRDLVIALRDHACLAWGAVDFGPGASGSGDMMHFDTRTGGILAALTRGVGFVPTKGHPCLSATAQETTFEAEAFEAHAEAVDAEAEVEAVVAEAEAEDTAEARQVPHTMDYLDGRLWTFVSATSALPVAVFCPEPALSAQSVDILLFAHGLLHGCPHPTHVPSGFITDAPFALGPIVKASGRPLILAVPLLDWAHPGGERAFGRGHERRHALGHPELLNRLLAEVLNELAQVRDTTPPALTHLYLAGHSRAYDLLEPLAESRHRALGEDSLAKLSAVWAFDTTYTGRPANWTSWLENTPELSMHVYYRSGSRTGRTGDDFLHHQAPRLSVTRVTEPHCAVPATRLPALLGPSEPTKTESAPPVPLEELTTRIARCIGIWETNRGGTDPAPQESSLDTVAGVHASMATIEQATMPYAITVLRRHKHLRDRAQPPLILQELNTADARCTAVAALLTAVTDAWRRGTTPDDFLAANQPAVTTTGLDDDVRTMFRAEALRSALSRARLAAEAAGQAAADKAAQENRPPKDQSTAARTARRRSLAASLTALPAVDRLGLRESSLRAYLTRESLWGEHRAGWQRRAVAALPDDVGRRIEAVAVSDKGTALALPTIHSRIEAHLTKTPTADTEAIVRAVAQRNNPHEPDYGLHVWQTYQRLYPD